MRQPSDHDDPPAGTRRVPRKAYASPRLVRYGDVAHLTRSSQAPGKLKDNPTVNKSRTV